MHETTRDRASRTLNNFFVRSKCPANGKGDRICPIGGIYGTIVGIKDDTVTLSVGRDNLTMVVARWGIRSVEEVTIENDAQELN